MRGFGLLLLGVLALTASLWIAAPHARAVSSVDQQVTIGSGGCASLNASRPYAQTFIAGRLGRLDSISLFISGAAAENGDLVVEVRSASGGAPSTVVLGSGAVTRASIPTAASWVNIPLTTPASMVANTAYALVVSSTAGTSGTLATSYCWGTNVANPYAAGSALYRQVGIWLNNTGMDLLFQTFVENDVTPPVVTLTIPTPPPGQGGAFNAAQSPVIATVSARDPSEITAITCSDTGGGIALGPLVSTPGAASRTVSVSGDGIHALSCAATDGSNNTGAATGSSASGSLVIDVVLPIVAPPAAQALEATGPTGTVATFAVSAVDPVSGPLPATCLPASGSVFPLGVTSVTCSAVDAAGNIGTASFALTVRDSTPPTLTIPADIVLEATSLAGATATYAVTASDVVSGTITPMCTRPSGGTFPLGVTAVTCSATDAAGNSGSGAFSVTVRDTSPPVITASARTSDGASYNAGTATYLPVTVTFVCTDVATAVAALTPPITVAGPTATGTASGSCTDGSGITASITFTGIVISPLPMLFGVSRTGASQPGALADGPVSGGTAITISGANLISGPVVSLGGVTATGVTVVNSTTITAVTGAHPVGVVDIVVSYPGATRTLAQRFAYGGPLAPMQIVGGALINGVPAPGGTSIKAYINGTLCGSATTVPSFFLSFTLQVASASQVAACGVGGEPVTFTANDAPATPGTTFVAGSGATLTLASGGASPTPSPTASPTRTPAATPTPTPSSGSAPMTVTGRATINGVAATAGTPIAALVGGVVCTATPTTSTGAPFVNYTLQVLSAAQRAGCAIPGSTVAFTVGGGVASGTTTWSAGGSVRVDLAASSGSGTSPSPTPTPAPTPSAQPTPTPSTTPSGGTPTPTPTPSPAGMLQPMAVAGFATLNGATAPAGTRIIALVGGRDCTVSPTLTTATFFRNYSVTVKSVSQDSGCATAGAIVTFTVGGISARQTVTFVSGGTQTLTLTAP